MRLVFTGYKSVADCEDPKMRRYRSGVIARRRNQEGEVLVRPVFNYRSLLVGWDGVKATGLIHRSREINDLVHESSEMLIGRHESQVLDQPRQFREHFGVANKVDSNSERKRSKTVPFAFVRSSTLIEPCIPRLLLFYDVLSFMWVRFAMASAWRTTVANPVLTF
jgi:hypothetical protein